MAAHAARLQTPQATNCAIPGLPTRLQSYLLKRGLPWVEVALLAAWVVWCPLLIWLACFRRQWYVRHRTPLICTLRLCRMLSGEPCGCRQVH